MTGIYLEPGRSIFAQNSKTYYKIIKYLGQGGNAIAFRVQWSECHLRVLENYEHAKIVFGCG